MVDLAEFAILKATFGVPEPCSIVLLACGGMAVIATAAARLRFRRAM